MTVDVFVDSGEATGFIGMWHGLLSNIPSGWVLCDGNNGTPNLLGEFKKGTASATEAPGTTGGADSVTISESQLPAHSHGGTTSSDGNHDHTFDFIGGNDSGSGFNSKGGWAEGDDAIDHDTSKDGAHSNPASGGSTGGDSSHENRPAYFELAYIMKT